MFFQKTHLKILLSLAVLIGALVLEKSVAQELGSGSHQTVASFPFPGPSPQDLAWDGTFLWVADDSTDMIYKLNPSDGSEVLSFPSPGPEPKGLTWDGTHLWNSDDYSTEIFRIDTANGEIVSAIEAPFIAFGEGHSPLQGLAWDGNYLWSAYYAGWSSRFSQIDPTEGEIVSSYFCGTYPKGLAFDGSYLWSVSYNGGRWIGKIIQRNLTDGSWRQFFDTPGYYPGGLTFGGGYLWLADTGTRLIYKIEISPRR